MIKTILFSKFASLIIAIYNVGCLLTPINQAYSQTPDWSTTIAPIIYDHCSRCHHEGAIAPFPLMTYEDAALWAGSIVTQVNASIMPPWPPDPNYNHLMNENVLSEDEINALNLWVDNGTPPGNLDLAPPPPVFNGNSLMVNPDETVHLGVFTLPDVDNVYWRFTNQSGYTETKYINSVEFVAGNPSVIHHVSVGLDDSGLAWEDDQNYPGPGCPRDFGSSPAVKVFMAQSEGRVIILPENLGFEVPADNDYVTDMHFFNDSIGEIDSSKINLKFCTVADIRSVYTDMLLYGHEPSLIDGPLEIPANTVKTFHLVSDSFTEDQSLLGLGPHSHQICTSWEVYMVVPSGDTIPLIKIPNWDFDWQGGYLFTKVIKIPAGSFIFGTVVYDNTVNNPDNPSNPPKDVYGNSSMLGEMAQVHGWVMDYLPGDEDIILDSAFYGVSTSNHSIEQKNFINVFPNPASQSIRVEYRESNSQEVDFSVYNNLGKLLFYSAEQSVGGSGSIQLDCSVFSPGVYLLSARSGNEVSHKKFVIVK